MAKGIAHRKWRIDRDEFHDHEGRVDEQAFRAAVQQELALAEHLCERLGVAIVAAPIRTRFPDGDFFTIGWAFETATIPAAHRAEADVEPDEIGALEDALAEPVE
jgi:hypothetical protein